MRITTHRRILSVAAAAALTLAACGGDDNEDTADDTPAATESTDSAGPEEPAETDDVDPVSVKIAADSFLLGTQAWVAQDRGFFEDQAVDADVSMFGTGIEAIQGVIASQADIGHALDFAVLNLVAAADENMSIIGAIAQPSPGFHSLAVSNDITSAADLTGKKIGYVEGTSEHFVTIQHLEQNGIDVTDVELVNMPGLFELVGALKTGDVDAGWTWLDGTNQAAEDPNLSILGNDSEVLETVAIYLIAETGWATENPETIERVLAAYDDASEYIASDVEGAAKIVADGTGGDAEVFAASLPGQNFQVGLTQPMLDSLDAIAQFLIDSDVLADDFDVRDFLKLDAMESAVPGSITAELG